MKTITFTVRGLPVSKSRPRFNRFSGHAYTPKETMVAENDFKAQSIPHAPMVPPRGAISLSVFFYKPRPQSMSKKVVHWTKKIDIDNALKLVMDSMNGIFWNDDAQITMLMATKKYDEVPRTEVVIQYLEEVDE